MRFVQIRRLCLFLALSFAIGSSYAHSDEIKIISDGKKTRVQVPTFSNGESPSVIVSEQPGVRFFATGQAAVNLSARTAAPAQAPQSEANLMIQLNLSELQLVRYKDQSVAAAIYPIKPYHQIFVTALHVLQKTPQLTLSQPWFGVLDENQQLLDIALSSPKLSLEEIRSQLSLLNAPAMGQYLQILHLTQIQDTTDPILSTSITQTAGVSNKHFYFRNSLSSQVGPQSSGAVIYDLATKSAVGTISCLTKVDSTGPGTEFIRAISLKDLARYHFVELNPDLLAQFQNQCEPYDGKRGGGD